MPDKADELRLAAFVEKLWRLELGIEPGPDRVYEPEGLTVDFVYPSSSPRPLALEVTRLANESWMASTSAAKKWGAELNEIAQREQLGYWWLYQASHVNVKELVSDVADMMRTGREGGTSRWYGWWLERRLDDLHGLDVVTSQTTSQRLVEPAWAIASVALDNADKLSAASAQYETHLAIETAWGTIPRQPWNVETPPLDGQFEPISCIDYVWVIPRVGQPQEPTAWWAQPGAADWSFSHIGYDSR